MSHKARNLPYWRAELEALLGGHREALVGDTVFLDNAFDPAETAKRFWSPEQQLNLLLDEAAQALAMIDPHLRPGARILELGGGVGLVYAILRSRGMEIVSLEPGGSGFGDRHRAGMRLLDILDVDPSGWLRRNIEDLDHCGSCFDLIFSYFVLEHVHHLNRAFRVMARVLAPAGCMVHRCPNYTVPFEPHYNIPLVPFRPHWTIFLYPGLRKRSIWRGLQFTTLQYISRLCAENGLRPTFRRGMAAWAFERVLAESEFATRKKGFVPLARSLRATGLLKMVGYLPPVLVTPMEFSASKV